jgi:tetratricopeptide (TPR) repeat protein
MKPRGTDFLFNETGCISSEVLLQYRDNTLTADEKHAVEEHLVDCPLCSDALEGLEGVDTVELREVEEEVRRIPDRHTKPGTGYWRAAAVMAGLSLITYIAFLQFGNIGEERMALNEPETPSAELESPLGNLKDGKDTVQQFKSASKEGQAVAEEKTFNEQEPEPHTGDYGLQDDIQYSRERANDNAGQSKAVPEESAPASTAFSGIHAVEQAAAPVDERNDVTEQTAVTYIDNRKVIDYSLDEPTQALEADKPRTAVKQPNRKQVAPVAAEPETKKYPVESHSYRREIADAMALFNKGRYESAIREFGHLLEKNPADQNALYYIALSHYHLKAYSKAVAGLSGYANNRQSPFYEEGRYYYAMALVQTAEIEKGRKLLSEIAGESGPFSEKAREALKL